MEVRLIFTGSDKYQINLIDSQINSQEWLKKVEEDIMSLLDESVEIRHTIMEDGGLHIIWDD